MSKLFSNAKFFNFCIFSTLVSFSLTIFLPTSLYAQVFEAGILNQALLAHKIKNNIEKLKKMENSSKTDKMISLMLEIKQDLENYSGLKISLNDHFNGIRFLGPYSKNA